MSKLYSKGGEKLPYELENKVYKWISEGEEKRRYELKWAVESSTSNQFVEQLSNVHGGLALSNLGLEARGPLTIVSATYGDAQFTDSQNVSWWTLSNGVYSFHIRRLVANNSTAIKAFCADCRHNYGYKPKEVSVTCNPQAGDEKVVCEATFTEENQVTTEEDDYTPPPEGEEGEAPEEVIQESGTSMQMASTINTIPVDAGTYLNKKIGGQKGNRLLSFCSRVESGEYRWVDAGTWGTNKPSKSGWFSTAQDASPTALEPNSYLTGEYSQDDVQAAIVALKSIPSVMVPQIRVTITTKVTSASKLTMASMGASSSSAGSTTKSINESGVTMNVPAGLTKAKDTEGNEYELETEWLDEGTSFDISNIETKTSLSGKKFYQGVKTHSYSTISTVKPILDGEGGQRP